MAGQGNGNKTDAQLAKIAAREDWFKLVVKIINWKDGNPESGSTALGCRITSKEWKDYTKGCLSNHLINGKESAINALQLTKQKIQSFGGFE